MLIMKAMGKYNGESSLNVLNAIHCYRVKRDLNSTLNQHRSSAPERVHILRKAV